jgi:chloramphenicol O-acetyltransferase type B
MLNEFMVIDEKNWKRAIHCQVFRNSIEPQYCVTFELDISNFLKMVKDKKYSFTLSLIYVVSMCANSIEEFRYRFLDGKVVLFNKIDTAFTYMNQDTELFKVVNVELKDTLEEYVPLAYETARNQEEYFAGPLGNNVFQFSPMPWVSYTHISHTNAGKKDNATPIFVWGKFFERDGKVFLPFSVQVHHSFVDGIHIGRFSDILQNKLNEY